MPFIVNPKPKAIINCGFTLKFHNNVHSKILRKCSFFAYSKSRAFNRPEPNL